MFSETINFLHSVVRQKSDRFITRRRYSSGMGGGSKADLPVVGVTAHAADLTCMTGGHIDS